MSETLILVVEDESSIAEVVSLYLKRAGYSVQIASDGRQAMNIFQRQKPDFVILDLMLPEVDGLSLTRWLRERSNVPIIMLTARRGEVDRIAGLEVDLDVPRDAADDPSEPERREVRGDLSDHPVFRRLEIAVVHRRLSVGGELVGQGHVIDRALFVGDPRRRLVQRIDDRIVLRATGQEDRSGQQEGEEENRGFHGITPF